MNCKLGVWYRVFNRGTQYVNEMILESLVTTTDPAGRMHLAPMGPRIREDWSGFLLRPFPSSKTFQHLKATREGVMHVTDDAALIARGAVNQVPPVDTRPASVVNGYIINNACRFYEFRVTHLDETQERMQIECEIVHRGVLREFFGLNRAKHAVVEAAILATRLHLLPRDEVVHDLTKLQPLIDKTGGPAEIEAFRFLKDHIHRVYAEADR